MSARVRPYLVLALLWAAYFHPLLLHPGRVLYTDYSDFVAEHLPAKLFLNREVRGAGELPLWNPYHFCGTPFVHDIQVGIFYPPYAVTYLVPESALGAALSWVTALHVLLAGVLALVYARWRGLGEAGALVVAVGFMLSAKWMTHLILAAHTVTIGLAWLPLVLLGLESALRTGRVWAAVGAGVAFALLVLGTHPQWTFYAAGFVALWTLGPALERAGYLGAEPAPGRSLVRELARWAGFGLVVGLVAAPLTAVQLLPTLEASGQSVRTVATERGGALGQGVTALFALVGPVPRFVPPRVWEDRGVFGVFWLAAAVAAPLAAGRRAWWPAAVLLGLVAFAVGGSALVQGLPGFRLFRLHARALLVAAFPLAYVAGVLTDAAVRSGWDEDTRRALRRGFLVVVLVAVLPTLVCIGRQQRGGGLAASQLWGPFLTYWAGVAVSVLAFLWVCATDRGPANLKTGVWLAVLLAELVTPLPVMEVRHQSAIYPASVVADEFAARARPGQGRALDWYQPEFQHSVSPVGVGAPLALTRGFESVHGYNPLDVRHYREFVWVMCGGDGPLKPNDEAALPTLPNFTSHHPPMFALLGVRVVSGRAGDPDPLKVSPLKLIAVDPGPPAVPVRPPGVPDRLPPHDIYENPAAFPRVMLVPAARVVPAGRERDALKACDFRREVLLAAEPPAATPAGSGTARITDYRPNRVTIGIDGSPGGFLVLNDVWFPGWVARVDGREVPVLRANHAFRAVALPADAREVVFSFEPRSFRLGWQITAAAAGLLVLAGVLRLVLFRPRRGPAPN